MLKVTMKNLLAHKRRLLSTGFAVFFGVAFLAGTLMLSDTISKTFDDLFADVFADTDAVVRSSNVVEGEFGEKLRGRIEGSLVEDVQSVDGVAAAEGSVQGYAQIVGTDGEALGNPGMGPPTFGGDWPEIDELNPFNLEPGGEAPTTDEQVVIDRKSADDGNIGVDDRITVLTKSGPIEVTVVGIAKFGDADSPGGASFAMFTQDAAERYVGEPDMVDSVSVAGEDGVSQDELRDRIAAELDGDVEVLTGEQITEENQDDIAQALTFFSIFLGVFAGVALVVSVFSIYNTFSIIVAQRTRDMALLRAVGASRRQVLTSVLGEGIVLGMVASLLGLAGGVFIVALLKSMLAAFGLDLPAGGLVLKPSTVVVSLVVGFVVTVVSAVGPAVRASRVPPLAAMRDVAVDTTARSRVRLVIGVIVTLLGILATFGAVAGGGSDGLFVAGLGVLLVLIGTIVLGPVAAAPLSRLLGAPLTRFRGVTGRLAQQNSARNPKRTANTAAALLIGVGVVGFFTVLAASIKESSNDIIERTVTGDFVVASNAFGGASGGLSPTLTEDLNDLPEVSVATALRYGTAEVDGDGQIVTAIDPDTFGSLVDAEVTAGSLEDLGDDGIAVFRDQAEDDGVAIGDPVTVRFPQTGEQQFQVVAIYDRNELTFGSYLMSDAAYAANVPDQFDNQIFVDLADGVSAAAGRTAIESLADAYPQADVQDQEEYKDAQAAPINQILGLVYAMLAFAVLIALMGIANTLSLSVHERTRELGLMRAVGMSRGQLRSSVRWESVIIAVFGTLGGLSIAVFFSWVAVIAANEENLGFVLPIGSLVFLVILAALAGVVAALLPAYRAAKLDVLQAIATE